MKTNRQTALEDFLNDRVEKLHMAVYKWRGKYYEVIPFTQTLRRHSWSQYIKLPTTDYVMRELSEDMLTKYYPSIDK